ncbi:hypothetical protein [Streptomyces sp. PH10-H1]|uniref:hypothetical protein n=1 Tax=Streptomyces sp. PH10-H1 TaxID=3046212 RepID=UPI0024B8A510|nr:hypothetical protein [Streptomyces sp. PH10-H1]MDJ0343002.1 hypothetical protein [Streptomyces sp. PH10-H1]
MTPHEFDHLPFPARMRALAGYARGLDDARYRALRAALDAGDPDERHTALFLAVARRDLSAVTAALDDPLLRTRAMSAAIRLPIPEQALAGLALSEIRAVRHDTYRVLRLSRRRTLADRLLPEVHERHGRAEAARLLPACTPGAAAEWLPRLDAPPGVLRSLARTAPGAVAAQLAAVYRDCADPHERSTRRFKDPRLVSTLTERDPDAGLLLLERAPELLTERAMSVLLRRPRAVLESVRRTGAKELPLAAGPLPRSALRAVRALGPRELAELAGVCTSSHRREGPFGMVVAPDPLLVLLPADVRVRIVAARVAEAKGGYALPLTALAALPPADRAALLERFMPQALRSPRRLRHVAATLPLAAAEPLLREGTDSHRVHVRVHAWPALLTSAQLQGDPAEYARIVVSCERAWHDQDMVRQAALTQAAGAPARLLSAVSPQSLRDAALTTVQSRDSTARTLAAAERWLRRAAAVAAGRGDGERAAAVALLLAEIVADPRRAGGAVPLRLGDRAPRQVWEAARRAELRPRRLIALAELLAGNGAPVPELDALVERIALADGDPQLAARAAGVWLADPATRSERCGRLIAADPSFASVPRVLHTLANRRTDLLDTVLDPGVTALDPGARTGTPWVPRLPRSVTGRWLPRQRALLDQRLVSVATDEDATLRQRADAAALLRDELLLRCLADDAPQPVAAAALSPHWATWERARSACSSSTPQEREYEAGPPWRPSGGCSARCLTARPSCCSRRSSATAPHRSAPARKRRAHWQNWRSCPANPRSPRSWPDGTPPVSTATSSPFWRGRSYGASTGRPSRRGSPRTSTSRPYATPSSSRTATWCPWRCAAPTPGSSPGLSPWRNRRSPEPPARSCGTPVPGRPRTWPGRWPRPPPTRRVRMRSARARPRC